MGTMRRTRKNLMFMQKHRGTTIMIWNTEPKFTVGNKGFNSFREAEDFIDEQFGIKK